MDFISDLHLRAGEPETYLAWQNYMLNTRAQAVFILGDLFEVWVGDDVVNAAVSESQAEGDFEARCAGTLKRSAAQRDVFFMHGNRDFLVGETFTRTCDVKMLDDPCVLVFGGQRWLLSHGDALCLDDTEYMQFRSQVRSTAWQQEFLAQPLEQRKTIARQLRARSEALKRSHPLLIDVDAQAAVAWLNAADATHLIHGHTHRPADHSLRENLQRTVLSDWDLQANPPRAQVFRITIQSADGFAKAQRLTLETA